MRYLLQTKSKKAGISNRRNPATVVTAAAFAAASAQEQRKEEHVIETASPSSDLDIGIGGGGGGGEQQDEQIMMQRLEGTSDENYIFQDVDDDDDNADVKNNKNNSNSNNSNNNNNNDCLTTSDRHVHYPSDLCSPSAIGPSPSSPSSASSSSSEAAEPSPTRNHKKERSPLGLSAPIKRTTTSTLARLLLMSDASHNNSNSSGGLTSTSTTSQHAVASFAASASASTTTAMTSTKVSPHSRPSLNPNPNPTPPLPATDVPDVTDLLDDKYDDDDRILNQDLLHPSSPHTATTTTTASLPPPPPLHHHHRGRNSGSRCRAALRNGNQLGAVGIGGGGGDLERDFYTHPTLLSRLILYQNYGSATRRVRDHPEEARIWMCVKRARGGGGDKSNSNPTKSKNDKKKSSKLEIENENHNKKNSVDIKDPPKLHQDLNDNDDDDDDDDDDPDKDMDNDNDDDDDQMTVRSKSKSAAATAKKVLWLDGNNKNDNNHNNNNGVDHDDRNGSESSDPAQHTSPRRRNNNNNKSNKDRIQTNHATPRNGKTKSSSRPKNQSNYSLRQLPIHMACRSLSRVKDETLRTDLESLIAQLVITYPDGCARRDHEKRLPLHEAIWSNASLNTISALLIAAPTIVQERDRYGRTVFQLNQLRQGGEKFQLEQLLSKPVQFWEYARQEAILRLKHRYVPQADDTASINSTDVLAESAPDDQTIMTDATSILNGRAPPNYRHPQDSTQDNDGDDDDGTIASIQPIAWNQLERRAILLEQELGSALQKNFEISAALSELRKSHEQLQQQHTEYSNSGGTLVQQVVGLREDKAILQRKVQQMQLLLARHDVSVSTTASSSDLMSVSSIQRPSHVHIMSSSPFQGADRENCSSHRTLFSHAGSSPNNTSNSSLLVVGSTTHTMSDRVNANQVHHNKNSNRSRDMTAQSHDDDIKVESKALAENEPNDDDDDEKKQDEHVPAMTTAAGVGIKDDIVYPNTGSAATPEMIHSLQEENRRLHLYVAELEERNDNYVSQLDIMRQILSSPDPYHHDPTTTTTITTPLSDLTSSFIWEQQQQQQQQQQPLQDDDLRSGDHGDPNHAYSNDDNNDHDRQHTRQEIGNDQTTAIVSMSYDQHLPPTNTNVKATAGLDEETDASTVNTDILSFSNITMDEEMIELLETLDENDVDGILELAEQMYGTTLSKSVVSAWKNSQVGSMNYGNDANTDNHDDNDDNTEDDMTNDSNVFATHLAHYLLPSSSLPASSATSINLDLPSIAEQSKSDDDDDDDDDDSDNDDSDDEQQWSSVDNESKQ